MCAKSAGPDGVLSSAERTVSSEAASTRSAADQDGRGRRLLSGLSAVRPLMSSGRFFPMELGQVRGRNGAAGAWLSGRRIG
jgi:hypothetical protein